MNQAKQYSQCIKAQKYDTQNITIVTNSSNTWKVEKTTRFFFCTNATSKKKRKREKYVDGHPQMKAEWLNIVLRRLNKVQTCFLPHKPLKEVASLAGFFVFFKRHLKTARSFQASFNFFPLLFLPRLPNITLWKNQGTLQSFLFLYFY